MNHFDIIVIGGGLVGASFALDLAKRSPKLEIAILEPKPLENNIVNHELDNRIYAISPSNLDYLSRISGDIDPNKTGTIKTMDIYGDNEGYLVFSAKEVNQLFLAKTVEYNYLQNHVYKQLKDLINIHFIYGHIENISVNDSSAQVSCTDKVYSSNLLVGSDGANSITRKYANLETEAIIYDQRGVVANFECELPHKNTAYQWFHQGEILAYLPLPGNKISIVWSTPNYKKLVEASDEQLCSTVAKAAKYKLGNLKLVTKPAVFPLKLYLVKKLYSDKIVLIGDAAHTIHPLAGQGVNLGFTDASVLAKLLGDVKQYQLSDISLLAKYNALRLPDIRQMQLTCHGLHNLFNTGQPIISSIRNVGLNLINNLPMVKKYLINSAIKD